MTDHEMTLLDCGLIEEPREFMYLHEGGDNLRVPIVAYLVTHPRGNVLVESGLPVELSRDRGYWQGLDFMKITMDPGQHVVAQLQSHGIDPDSVRYVILSHLHLDHVGGIGHLPKAEFIVHRAEWEHAHDPDWFCKGLYHLEDIDRPEVQWRLLDLSEEDRLLDLYGDGRIRIAFTPGHSVGHLSTIVRLDGLSAILAGDVASVAEHYRSEALGFWVDLLALDRSIKFLHEVEESETIDLVVFSHDDAQVNELRGDPRLNS